MIERISKTILLPIGVLFFVFFCIFPVVWMLALSLSKSPYFFTSQIDFSFTLDNYHAILFSKSLPFMDYLKNSIIISFISAFCAAFISTFSAYAITRMQFPGRILIPVMILSVSMFPQISIVGYIFQLMAKLKWINTYYALIFPYIALSLPLGLWIMMSYFSQLPIDLDKAALIDGATRFQVVCKILFPISLPGFLSTSLLIFIFSFNEFLFALMLTVDYRARTIPVGISLFQGLHGQVPWGSIMAAASVASLPLIILTVIFQRYIIRGLTEGAVKR